jgi:hypothetical protein
MQLSKRVYLALYLAVGLLYAADRGLCGRRAVSEHR